MDRVNMDSVRVFDVMVCGYLCVDMVPIFKPNGSDGVPRDEFTFRPGMLMELDGMTFTLGGLVGNTGLVLHKIGKRVLACGLVGQDHLGQLVLDKLTACGMAHAVSTSTEEGTAFGIVLAPAGVDRMFLESPGCSRLFGRGHVDPVAIAQSRLLHFGYIPLLHKFFEAGGVELHKLLDACKERGTVTSMDLSMPDSKGDAAGVNWRELLHRVLPLTDILMPSMEEILFMLLPDSYRALCEAHGEQQVIDHVPMETVKHLGRTILGLGVKIVLIKMAHRGLYLATGSIATPNEGTLLGLDAELWSGRELFCEAYPLDTTRNSNASGAGDTAVAAFLSAVLDGESPERALGLSAMAGRESLYCNDICAEMADWTQIAENVDKLPPTLSKLELTTLNE